MAGAREIPVEQLGSELSRMARQTGPQALAPALKAAAVMVVSDVKAHMAAGRSPDGTPYRPLAFPRPSGGAGAPLRDKGLLMASVTCRAVPDGLVLSSNRPGARLHQEGGVVVPVRAKALAIPLSPQAARSRPRAFPQPLHVLWGARGGALVDQKGKAHYALTRGPVRVPARRFLGFSAGFLDRLRRLLEDAWAKALGS